MSTFDYITVTCVGTVIIFVFSMILRPIPPKIAFEEFRDERFKKAKYKRDIKDENDVVTVTITES